AAGAGLPEARDRVEAGLDELAEHVERVAGDGLNRTHDGSLLVGVTRCRECRGPQASTGDSPRTSHPDSDPVTPLSVTYNTFSIRKSLRRKLTRPCPEKCEDPAVTAGSSH